MYPAGDISKTQPLQYVLENLPYWDSRIDDQAADYLLNVKSDDKVLSDKILKKMVNQRRRKQLLREEIESLAKSFRELLSHA